MYPGIELRLYRYVSVLAEELNFTQAALRLYVSQPTLSAQVRDLEREIEPRFGDCLKRLFAIIRVHPRIFHEVTNQAEALEIVAQDGMAAITTPAAQHPGYDRIVFRTFFDEILTAETGLAYFGEPTSPGQLSARRQRCLRH